MTAGVKAYQQGHYADAEKSLQDALKEAERFVAHDRRLAISLNNLAALYHAQGKYVKAELLYKRALAIREKAQGSEHPDFAQSLNNLAMLYHALGKYVEAEPLYKRSLGILEKALGLEHPNVTKALENYADLLGKMKCSAEAAKMEARARAIRAKHAQENPAK